MAIMSTSPPPLLQPFSNPCSPKSMPFHSEETLSTSPPCLPPPLPSASEPCSLDSMSLASTDPTTADQLLDSESSAPVHDDTTPSPSSVQQRIDSITRKHKKKEAKKRQKAAAAARARTARDDGKVQQVRTTSQPPEEKKQSTAASDPKGWYHGTRLYGPPAQGKCRTTLTHGSSTVCPPRTVKVPTQPQYFFDNAAQTPQGYYIPPNTRHPPAYAAQPPPNFLPVHTAMPAVMPHVAHDATFIPPLLPHIVPHWTSIIPYLPAATVEAMWQRRQMPPPPPRATRLPSKKTFKAAPTVLSSFQRKHGNGRASVPLTPREDGNVPIQCQMALVGKCSGERCRFLHALTSHVEPKDELATSASKSKKSKGVKKAAANDLKVSPFTTPREDSEASSQPEKAYPKPLGKRLTAGSPPTSALLLQNDDGSSANGNYVEKRAESETDAPKGQDKEQDKEQESLWSLAESSLSSFARETAATTRPETHTISTQPDSKPHA